VLIIAVDPGSEESALVRYAEMAGRVLRATKRPNLEILAELSRPCDEYAERALVIESFEPRGQPLYRQLIDTAIWVGRFFQCWHDYHPPVLLSRETIKRHLLGTSRGGDANVRAALVDRFGGIAAKGTKKAPGPLHGIKGDCWAALAIAVVYADLRAAGQEPPPWPRTAQIAEAPR
jgi:hypothetical protein